MPDEAKPLAGRGVLVTRPAAQAERLSAMLERRGAHVLRFPLLHIAPPSDPNAAQAGLAGLMDASLVIFVSANAVRFAAHLLPDLPARLERARIACVGDATATALAQAGVMPGVVPQEASTSEALLAQDEFQQASVQGRDVVLVRGEGGRDLLIRVLQERGARLRVVEVYRREAPRGDLPGFLDANHGAIDLAIVTSGESLQRLVELAGADRVRSLPLVLPSDRVLEQAVALGFSGPFVVPAKMNDVELARAACRLAACVAGTRT